MATTMRLPEAQVRTQLEEAISSADGIAAVSQNDSIVRTAYETWDKRNEIVLERAFEKHGFLDTSPKDDYCSALGLTYPFGPALSEEVTTQGLLADIQVKVGRLQQILATLDVYSDPPPAAEAVASDKATTVFVVHGRPQAPRMEVELLIRKATSVEPVVLTDQVNKGATLIEKLEEHLGGPSFAVIIMTADDLGHLDEAGANSAPRARQNVVLELGFAMGALGRRKVAILHEEGIELPSDISGVGYYPLDQGGAWKARLLGELQAAGIEVDANALLGN